MFCSKCGKEVPKDSEFCASCGYRYAGKAGKAKVTAAASEAPVSVSENMSSTGGQVPPQPQYYYVHAKPVNPQDARSGGWAFLSVVLTMLTTFVPLILYVLWKDEFPQRSQSILKGMIIGFIITAVLVVVFIIGYTAFLIGITWWTMWMEGLLGAVHVL